MSRGFGSGAVDKERTGPTEKCLLSQVWAALGGPLCKVSISPQLSPNLRDHESQFRRQSLGSLRPKSLRASPNLTLGFVCQSVYLGVQHLPRGMRCFPPLTRLCLSMLNFHKSNRFHPGISRVYHRTALTSVPSLLSFVPYILSCLLHLAKCPPLHLPLTYIHTCMYTYPCTRVYGGVFSVGPQWTWMCR